MDHVVRRLDHEGRSRCRPCLHLASGRAYGVLVATTLPGVNNTAEYEALINGLRIVVELGIKRLEIRGDSELVVDQVMKDKNCMDLKMAAYCQVVRDLEDKFHRLELHHVLCDYNKAADVLAKTAYSRSPVPHGVFASDQHAPSVRAEGEKPLEEEEPEVMVIDQPPELNLEDPLKIPTGGFQSSSG
jgi:ribonuclease HI